MIPGKGGYKDYARWVTTDCEVFEKRSWGWKFIGIAKSATPCDVMNVLYNDCDHPKDIINEYVV